MSEIRYDRDGLTIATYAGPIPHDSPNSNSRMMVQIDYRGVYVSLPMDHWTDLVCFIRRMDSEGIGITQVS